MRKIKKYKFKTKPTIIIILVIITLSILVILIYKQYQQNKDIYDNKNLLLGTWIYNEYEGAYVFNDDYTYIQYTNKDTSNNYCKGTYKYTYGATNNKGLTIRQDENYYYYNLSLKVKECIIMNKKTNDEYTKKMYFGIYKNENFNEIIFANVETENIFKLTKVN